MNGSESAWERLQARCDLNVGYFGGTSNCGQGAANLLRHYGKGAIAVWADGHYFVFPPGYDESTLAENLGWKIQDSKPRYDIRVEEPVTYAELKARGFTDKTEFVLQRTQSGKWIDEAF